MATDIESPNTSRDRPQGLRPRLAGFLRNRSGVAAVEFALIAAPFFFLLFAMIEVAAVFFMGSVMENAVLEAARDIRTGRAQSSGMSEGAFKNAVCNRISMLGSCDNVEIDVRVFEDFDGVDQSSPIDEGEMDTDDFGFDPGDAGDIVLVRAFYRWKLLTPGFTAALANMDNNEYLVSAATVFRNEPFDE